jgi:cholinesterase
MKLAIAHARWLILASLATTIAPSTAQWTLSSTPPAVGASVNTSSGPVTGHAARNRTAVSEYLGIPYAQPPVGQLRFAPPQAYSSSRPFNASSYVCIHPFLPLICLSWLISVSIQSPGCPANPAKRTLNYPDHTAQELQIVAHFATQDGTLQSEDCLTLNIWSKASRKLNKPVLVWFYGGRARFPS